MSDGPDREQIAEFLRTAGADKLPGHLQLELVEITEGGAVMRCDISTIHSAPNGYLHAGSIISLADTTAGYGVMGNLPEGATGFTTIEMKANFFSTLMEGTMEGGFDCAWRSNHPGLGCGRHRRGDRKDHGSFPLHSIDPVSESVTAPAHE